jgi:glycosyltransferase involved in cell wall biosynthesis
MGVLSGAAMFRAALSSVRENLAGLLAGVGGHGRRPGADGRITVLQIMDRLNVGGAALHAVLVSRGLDRTKYRTVLVVGSVEANEGDMGYLLEERGPDGGVEKVVSIPSLGRELRPLRDLETTWRLLQVMRLERPAIVHTHKSKAGAIGRLAALVCGVPVRVHTFHGHVLRGYFGPAKSAFYRGLERLLAVATSKLVVLSPRLVDELSDELKVARRDRFEVIPLGFDLDRFADLTSVRGQLRRELGVGNDVRLIGIVGRMVPVKDHATFVAAAHLLARRRPDVHLVFVGGGELEAAIRADIDGRGLTARAHFLGWRRDLGPIYADLDVVALSSINEGTPVSLIEALAAEVPVVGTAVGGVPDLLRGGTFGALVPAGDAGALATAMEVALAPEARARAGAAGAVAREEFGRRRLCLRLETLYQQLLDERG